MRSMESAKSVLYMEDCLINIDFKTRNIYFHVVHKIELQYNKQFTV